jgi:NADH dehydrogenase
VDDTRRPRIVVLGAGFAGLRAVRVLADAGRNVLWIDGRNYHTFLPLLYQVATAGLEPQAIVYPTRSFLRRLPGVQFRMERVVGGDAARHELVTADGDRIKYDRLIVATGGAAADFGIPGVREHTFKLYDVEDARALRNHILLVLEQAAGDMAGARVGAALTFVIVGGGPTGVETAGAIAEFQRHVIPRDYGLRDHTLRIILVEAGPTLLAPFDESLRNRAKRDLEAFGVDVRLNTTVAKIDADCVHLADGERIETHTVVWAAGIRAGDVTQHLGLPLGRSGRIRVDENLVVPGHPEVFAAGDVAIIDGKERLPQVAQMAMQTGEHAAENLLRGLRREPLVPFEYDDKGSMATIGRSRAIVQIGRRIRLAGAIAWWAWLALHIVMLIGFRNRLVVLVDWAWNYLTYDRGLRAIVGPVTPPPDEDTVAASTKAT